MRAIIMLLPVLATVGAPATAQVKALDKVNNFLSRITGTPVAGRPAGAPVRSAPASILSPSAEQSGAMTRALAAGTAADIAADRQSAQGLIADIVQTSACATDARAWNRFNRVNEKPMTYTTDYTSYVPMVRTHYHDKNQCLDVIRIDEWTKPAKNALRFRVRLISAQSDEAMSQDFILVRQPSSEWMVREIGYTRS